MLEWIKQRAKAFVASFVAVTALPVALAITTGTIKAFETATGIDIPADWETGILATVSATIASLIGFNAVSQTSNKPIKPVTNFNKSPAGH